MLDGDSDKTISNSNNNSNTVLHETRLHVYDGKNRIRFLVDSGSVTSVIPRLLVNMKLKQQ